MAAQGTAMKCKSLDYDIRSNQQIVRYIADRVNQYFKKRYRLYIQRQYYVFLINITYFLSDNGL